MRRTSALALIGIFTGLMAGIVNYMPICASRQA